MSTATSPTYTVSLGEGADLPMTAEQIRAAYKAGTIRAKTLVWREGLDRWLAVSALADEIGVEIADEPMQSVVMKVTRPHMGSIDEPSLKKEYPKRPQSIDEARRRIGAQSMNAQVATPMVDQNGNPYVIMVNTRSRGAYVALALFLGPLGLHNFYAGYIGGGVGQLLFTLIFCALVPPLILLMWFINLLECVFTKQDAQGIRMV